MSSTGGRSVAGLPYPSAAWSPWCCGGHGIAIEDVVRVARERAPVELGDEARARLSAGRAALDAAIAAGTPVYGATRGLGSRSGEATPPDPAREHVVIRARAASVGPPLPDDVVRAALCARLAGLAAGGAGVAPATADALAGAAGRRRGAAAVPGIGSVGMSDLVLLAHAALPLVEGPALAPKDGLALVATNAVAAGWGALLVHDAEAVLRRADETAALSLEAYVAGLSPLDPRVAAARPAAGQVEAAARLRALLAGSALERPGAARRLQDPLSFRCLASVHGCALAALAAARAAVEVELAAASDNPLVVAADGEVLPNGNFHAGALALAVSGARAGAARRRGGQRRRASPTTSTTRSSDLPRCLSTAVGTPGRPGAAAEVGGRAGAGDPPAGGAGDARRDGRGARRRGPDGAGAAGHRRRGHDRRAAAAACWRVELVCAAQAIDLRGTAGDLGAGDGGGLPPRAPARGAARATERPTGPDVDRLAAALA